MNFVKGVFGGNTRQFGMIFALVALILFFQVRTEGQFLRPANVINIFQGNSYILVLAVGMVLVIIAGHIDLSVGSVAAAVGIIVAQAMQTYNLPTFAGILLGLACGALIGAWQGWWTAYVGIPAFIVTLAGMLIFRGVNQMIGHSLSIPVQSQFQWIGNGYLPEVGPSTGYNNLTLLLGVLLVAAVILGSLRTRAAQAKIGATQEPAVTLWTRLALISVVIMATAMLMGSGRPGTSVPASALILGLLVLVYGFVANRTVLGRHIYAVGGNKHAAELSGVNAKRVNFLVMMNMSVLAALAGMIFVARSTASGPSDGTGWELDAIAAVFIGGAAVTGGVGTVVGSVIGGLVMAVLNNGLDLLGSSAELKSVLKGMVLLVAVTFDLYNKQQGRPSLIGRLMPKSEKKTGDTPPPDPTTPVEDSVRIEA